MLACYYATGKAPPGARRRPEVAPGRGRRHRVKVAPERLRQAVEDTLARLGVPPEEAAAGRL